MQLLTVIYSQEILPVFRYGIDRPTHWWMLFPRFFPVSVLHVSHTNYTASVYYISFKNIVRLLFTEQS